MAENKLPLFFRYRVLWHIVFWVVVYLSYVITFGGYMGHYYQELLNNLALMPARMLGTYSLVYLVLPLALKQKRFFLFSFLVIIHALLYAVAIWLTLKYMNLFPEIHDYSKLPFFFPSKIW